MKRPILYWVILFILGEVLCKIQSVFVFGFVIVGFIFLLLRNDVKKKRRPKKKILLFVGIVCFFLGFFCMSSWQSMMSYCESNVGETIQFQGQIVKRQESERKITYIVKTERLKRERIKVSVEFDSTTRWTLGSNITATGVVQEFNRASNPGAYDEKSYKQGNGIFVLLEDVQVESCEEPEVDWREALQKLQQCIAGIYDNLFETKNASLASAMVLGDKRNLDEDVKALYQRNGIAHLIAISGLHIAMIGGMLYKIFRRITGSYPVSAMIGGIFIVGYGVMTGLSGATLRAIIMLLTSIGADVFGRRYDGLTAIALALFVMLVMNPYQITQVGFLLSFGAVLGIVIIQPIWKMWFPKLPKQMDGLLVSVSVQLVLLPILLYYFYEVPVYGIFLNVIVVPLMNWLLMSLILCGMAGMVSISLASIPAKLADGIFALYEWVCKLSEQLPGHTWCVGQPSVAWIVFYYAVLCIAVWFAYHLHKKPVIVCMITGCVLCAMFLVPTKLLVCMFDVGQGDGIYIRTRHHQHILIDGGSSTQQKIGRYVLKNGLKYYGCNQLDYVFVSHSDSDHYSGIQELLSDELIVIENFVMPAIQNPDSAYEELIALAREKGCKIYYMQKGDELFIDDVTFRCLNPVKQEYEDKNEGSIVLQMTYKSFDMLFTGDFGVEGEKRILHDSIGSIEVLKVAHHGSATSTSDEFLKVIQPRVACISVGEKNRYGHPATEVMERLEQFAQKIYLTKDCGAITIETDGNEYEVCGSIRDGTH